MHPKVSIIMATYNRAHFILESLQSLLNQTYNNWECLIIDDGSTDDTEIVIKEFIKKDSRFIFTERPAKYQKGLPGCRNYGLDVAKGAYIIFFDDDDIVHPSNLYTVTKAIEENTKISFVVYQKQAFEGDFQSTGFQDINQINFTKTDKNFLESIVCEKTQMASCTVLWDRKCFDTIRFNEQLMYAEEWECYSRILNQNYKGIILDCVLYYNRKHAASNTGEFWRNVEHRVVSKKEAIYLIAKNLAEHENLTRPSLKYLVGLSINYRDKNLLNKLLKIPPIGIFKRLIFNTKYVLFPLWKAVKQKTK